MGALTEWRADTTNVGSSVSLARQWKGHESSEATAKVGTDVGVGQARDTVVSKSDPPSQARGGADGREGIKCGDRPGRERALKGRGK